MADKTSKASTEEILNRLKSVVGSKGVLTDPQDHERYLREWRDRFDGKAALVLRPSTTEQVSEVMKIAFETGIGIVPQGGNTGLVGGQIPSPDGTQIVLSLDRMTDIRNIDTINDTMTVDAGCILVTIQEAAAKADRLFPLSLASEGSARIGGLMSTNAGGINVLRYGNARDLALGLEVVLANGEMWSNLSGLRKDNTGYDLKQLFIGAEGTLGVITAVTIKLFPQLSDRATAIVGAESIEAAVSLLGSMHISLGNVISAFELVPQIAFDFLKKHKPDAVDPLSTKSPWYVMTEVSDNCAQGTLRGKLEECLSEVLGAEGILDAAITKNESERNDLWQMREGLSELQKFEGGSLKHDIAVPISNLAQFVAEATEAVESACPGIRPFPFGHLGDGNLHFNFSQPLGADKETFLAHGEVIARIVHDLVDKNGGSFSAEHGIGQLKRDELIRYKSQTEIDMMRAIKQVLDPKGIMNPGKVL